MEIIQIETSLLRAAEGKVLRKKSSGEIYGKECHLGYNYYEVGVGLAHPLGLAPSDFDEVDMPQDYEDNGFTIDQVSRLKRTDELIKQNIAEMNSLDLSASQALEVAHWYPVLFETEGYEEGQPIFTGTRVQYQGKLWEVRQNHNIVAQFAPSLATASLWMEVVEETADVGTIENPIPYEGNMALEEGKYYEQDGVVYLCTRSTGVPVYNALKDLVGIYVTEA
jgi:hypothetical protein